MLAPTHTLFSIFLTLIFLAAFGLEFSLHWQVLLFAILGAVLPDLDHPRSYVGSLFPFLSRFLGKRFGHRSVTHSFLGMGISLILVGSLFSFLYLNGIRSAIAGAYYGRFLVAFFLGYLSHLILDMATPKGIQLFWPNRGRDVIFKNPKFSIRTRSFAELVVFMVLLLFVILALPLSKYGLTTSLRWILANPRSVIEEYKETDRRTFLEFRGVLLDTKKKIAGRGEILDVIKNEILLFYEGQIYRISRFLEADILATKTRIIKSKRPIKIFKVSFVNKSREELLGLLQENALVSGKIRLPLEMELNISNKRFPTLAQSNRDLLLKYAQKKEIEALNFKESFALSLKKEQFKLEELELRRSRIKKELTKFENDGLTKFSKDFFLTRKSYVKKEKKVLSLNQELKKVELEILAVKLRLKERRLLFSGEVYLRYY